MRFLGLTGGIGCGKSTVAGIFKAEGAIILDADQMARQVVILGEPAYLQIVKHFGTGILQKDRELDRKKLASIVFNDANELKELNKITHREIAILRREMLEGIYLQCPQALVVNDVPLLFENQMESGFQKTILVTLDAAAQMERLIELRGFEKADVEARIANQMLQSEKKKRADFLIDNNGSIQFTQSQIESILQKINLLPQITLSDIAL
ncbi:MAG: dephospho-CoA kinase [SAR324 cluster bacterium]|uniref:Dephospho-CoA kinase n=1 Tax=SAR324 cluster bacterium TaxID=2024889 RepID=A0A2A4SRI0_9DELT|nr:MAG: dephospho-CoA kinase [SAR324 cluster bacterium]